MVVLQVTVELIRLGGINLNGNFVSKIFQILTLRNTIRTTGDRKFFHYAVTMKRRVRL